MADADFGDHDGAGLPAGGNGPGVNVSQGDIAFSKQAVVGTSNAWVWPFGAGLRFAS